MRVTDEQIIATLFANATNRAAAEAVGLTERQFYNRTRAPTFRVKLDRAKQELLEHATSAAESRLTAAVAVMSEIMDNTENAPQVRLNAASEIIRSGLKLMELADVSRRLDEIEKQLLEAKNR